MEVLNLFPRHSAESSTKNWMNHLQTQNTTAAASTTRLRGAGWSNACVKNRETHPISTRVRAMKKQWTINIWRVKNDSFATAAFHSKRLPKVASPEPTVII